MTDTVVEGVVVEESEVALVPVGSSASVARRDEWTIDELLGQVEKVKAAMQRAMDVDVHYGVIPGTGKKPTLLKPGAERLNSLFRLAPSYPPERLRLDWHDDGHFTATVVCVETHIPTGLVWSEGLGLCSSREKKYAYRNDEKVCPACGNAGAIIKGREDFGGGWLCFKKKDGCGAKFNDGDPAIESQPVGKVDNPDLPDTYNTVLKMAAKRALIAAVLNATAASDLFTQDVEDKPRPTEPSQAAAAATPQQAPPAATSSGTASKAQHAKHAVLLKELEEQYPRPEGSPSWTDIARDHVRETYGVSSRSQLDKEQMSALIEWTTEVLSGEQVPFS